MKVLVLGATGNMGSRLIPALLVHKHSVVAYVRSESKLKDKLPSSLTSEIKIVTGNAEDSAAITEALVTNRCDALVNTAGLGTVLPWQTPRMQGIIHAAADAAVEAGKTLKSPLRCWFMGGMTALDFPGPQGLQIVKR
ncbi:hypothetical protein P7C71_g1172, partial [Lecanoromycetidae sp. Uapishka_2]